MGAFFAQVWDIIGTLINPMNLRHPERFQAAFNQTGVFETALAAVNVIVFTETGLLIGFLLPGDSMLVVLGLVAQLSGWPLWPFLLTLSLAAILGDTVGYWIGYKAGPAIFRRPDSRFFKQEHLQAAKAFYERHGGKTIIFARFVPFIRTFAPVVAGAARMRYRTFLAYNVVGGISWIFSMVLFGYYLVPVADPLFQKLLGNPQFSWAKHIDILVIGVIGMSLLPIVWKWWKHRRQRAAMPLVTTPVPEPRAET